MVQQVTGSDVASVSRTRVDPDRCPAVVVEGGQECLSLSDQSRLTGLTAVRILPGRRWVFRAEWQRDDAPALAVFAKVFVGRQAARYAARDAQGVRWLMQAQVPTPPLLWQGHTADQSACVLIYQAISPAENADQCYQHWPEAQRLPLLQRLVGTLALQHASGLLQTDLHLKNFLLTADAVWSLDGDGIQRRALNQRQAYRQLAVLISKIRVLDQQAWADTLLSTYEQARGWPASHAAQPLLAVAKRLKAAEVRHYVTRKIFRPCTDVQWQQQGHFAQAVSTAGGLHMSDLPALEVAMHVGQVLKPGNTCTVVHTQLQDHDVVIKRYNIKHWWHALGRAWRPSRAAASWRNAHRLQYYGFNTPQPLLMYERRAYGLLRGRAYYVAAYSDWPDAMQFFARAQDAQLRDQAITQLVMLCYQWYLLQISHGDLKATNLQITAQGQVIVMDLDSMQQHGCVWLALRAHGKDLRRLLQNWKQDTSLYNALVDRFKQIYPDHAPLKLAGISI